MPSFSEGIDDLADHRGERRVLTSSSPYCRAFEVGAVRRRVFAGAAECPLDVRGKGRQEAARLGVRWLGVTSRRVWKLRAAARRCFLCRGGAPRLGGAWRPGLEARQPYQRARGPPR